MTLSDLAALGGFVSSLAVLISLVYLARQVTLSERQSRAAMDHNRACRIIDTNFAMAAPETAALMHRARTEPDTLTPAEVARYMAYCRAYFYQAEDFFLQRQAGMLSEAAFNSFFNNFRGFLRAKAPRSVWRHMRSTYDPGFAALMDSLCASARGMSTADSAGVWQQILADEGTEQTRPS